MEEGDLFDGMEDDGGFEDGGIESVYSMYGQERRVVTVRGRGLIFSVVHLPPLTADSPFTFTVLIIFFADTFQYVVW